MTAHGTAEGYRAHFDEPRTPTCPPCRRARAAEQDNYRRRRYLSGGALLTDSTGTVRRIHALAAIGWSLAEQSRRMGYEKSTVFAFTTRALVNPETAEKVRALYDELSMTPGPSKRARLEAQRKGWPPPLAYDDDKIDDPAARPSSMYLRPAGIDEVAVQRATHGERVHLSRAERAEVVRRLTRDGLSAAEIADRLGIAKRSVTRLRERKAA